MGYGASRLPRTAALVAVAVIVVIAAIGDWMAGFRGARVARVSATPLSITLLYGETRLAQAVYGDACLVAGVEHSGGGEAAGEYEVAFGERRAFGG